MFSNYLQMTPIVSVCSWVPDCKCYLVSAPFVYWLLHASLGWSGRKSEFVWKGEKVLACTSLTKLQRSHGMLLGVCSCLTTLFVAGRDSPGSAAV